MNVAENVDDVESLEENVINAQMKGKQEKWEKMRQQVSNMTNISLSHIRYKTKYYRHRNKSDMFSILPINVIEGS